MATTSPDNIWTPDSGDNYDYVIDSAATAASIQTALTRRANSYIGTTTQRTAFTSSAPEGTLWSDTDGEKILWIKQGASWIPVWGNGQGLGTPTGTIMQYAGATAPGSWLLCQGQAVSRSTYAPLFGVLGTRYGAGDGTSTFNLPDMRGRVPVGLDGGQVEFNALGKAGGAKTHTLTEAEMPAHTHSVDGPIGAVLSGTSREPGMGGSNGAGYTPWFGSGWDAQPARFQTRGADAPHNNLQPYLVLNYIIKT